MEIVAKGSDGRRLYTAEFKRAQVDRILKGEITASELSRELRVARSLIQRWKYLATKGAEAAVGSNGAKQRFIASRITAADLPRPWPRAIVRSPWPRSSDG